MVVSVRCLTLLQRELVTLQVDPLAPVHAIENFLIRHGYCKTEGTTETPGVEPISDDENDDDPSVDDLDDSLVCDGECNTGWRKEQYVGVQFMRDMVAQAIQGEMIDV